MRKYLTWKDKKTRETPLLFVEMGINKLARRWFIHRREIKSKKNITRFDVSTFHQEVISRRQPVRRAVSGSMARFAFAAK